MRSSTRWPRRLDERSELRHRHLVPADVERRHIDRALSGGAGPSLVVEGERIARGIAAHQERTGRNLHEAEQVVRRAGTTRPAGSLRASAPDGGAYRTGASAAGWSRAWMRTAATIAISVASAAQPIQAARRDGSVGGCATSVRSLRPAARERPPVLAGARVQVRLGHVEQVQAAFAQEQPQVEDARRRID